MNDDAKRRDLRVGKLVRDHYDFVWRSLRRLGVPEADLDDVLQEVFLQASKRLEEGADSRGYLFQTCVFLSSNARRKLLRRREVQDEARVHQAVDPRDTPEQDAARAEARVRLGVILGAMTEEQRTVFVLFELERLTVNEIASMFDLAPGTVASRLRRARELFSEAAHPTTGEDSHDE